MKNGGRVGRKKKEKEERMQKHGARTMGGWSLEGGGTPPLLARAFWGDSTLN
jgi:hypothetical protein